MRFYTEISQGNATMGRDVNRSQMHSCFLSPLDFQGDNYHPTTISQEICKEIKRCRSKKKNLHAVASAKRLGHQLKWESFSSLQE